MNMKIAALFLLIAATAHAMAQRPTAIMAHPTEGLKTHTNLWQVEKERIIDAIGPLGEGGGIEEAPIDGTIYGRQDAGWVEVAGGGGDDTNTVKKTGDVMSNSLDIRFSFLNDGQTQAMYRVFPGVGGGTPANRGYAELFSVLGFGPGRGGIRIGNTTNQAAIERYGSPTFYFSDQNLAAINAITAQTVRATSVLIGETGEEAASFPVVASPGNYVLLRQVNTGITSTYWGVISGQIAGDLNTEILSSIHGVTNRFFATGSDQTYTIPAGVTQIVAKLWGAGGAGGSVGTSLGGSGGTTLIVVPVTPGEVITVRVGQGGKRVGSNPANRIYPLAGLGFGATNAPSGGGYSGLLAGTNILGIAGGGGAAALGINTRGGGAGGGTSGEDAPLGGGGGTQIAGGGFLAGGDASDWSIGISSGGGGSGFWGGRASVTPGYGGGGGSGAIGARATFGLTFTGPITGDPEYLPGIGVNGPTASATLGPPSGSGGDGLVVILHTFPEAP